jgi:hypothetical protein
MAEPLTDQRLDEIEADVIADHLALGAGAPLSRVNSVAMLAPDGWVRGLIGEVRRLRAGIGPACPYCGRGEVAAIRGDAGGHIAVTHADGLSCGSARG